MRKIILYTLLIFLLLATMTLAYGFYNARQIRYFAKNASSIAARNDFDGELQSIEKYFKGASNQDTKTLEENTAADQTELDGLIKKTKNSVDESGNLKAPGLANSAKKDMLDYYAKAGKQAEDFKAVVGYINQVAEISSVFEKMNDNSTLEDIKSLIVDASNKNSIPHPNIITESGRSLTAHHSILIFEVPCGAVSLTLIVNEPNVLVTAALKITGSDPLFIAQVK